MNGLPVVRFNTPTAPAAFTRPVQDDFSIVCVFQSTQGLNSGTLYYQGAGLVNGKSPAWSTISALSLRQWLDLRGHRQSRRGGQFRRGYNDGRPHTFTFTRSLASGLVSLYVDGALAGTTTGGSQSLTSPRNWSWVPNRRCSTFSRVTLPKCRYSIQPCPAPTSNSSRRACSEVRHPSARPLRSVSANAEYGHSFELAPSSGAMGYHIKRTGVQGALHNHRHQLGGRVPPMRARRQLTSTIMSSRPSTPPARARIQRRLAPNPNGCALCGRTSSRKSPIAITEIMWKPAPRADGRTWNTSRSTTPTLVS